MPVSTYGCLSVLLGACALASLAGCSTSTPRFASGAEKHESAREPAKTSGPRFASREAEEERREDNRKVAPKEIERVTTGARSFRTEKNTAIKPLDQSKLMREISKYMGVSYVHGGASMEGMDCSGYTMTVYRDGLGIQLPRSSAEQATRGTPIEFKDLKFGDLVFFNTTGQPASHVGIYIGDDLFAHASVSLGVTMSSLESSYYQKRYEGARRIVQ